MEILGLIVVLYFCWWGFNFLREAEKKRDAEEQRKRFEEERRRQDALNERLKREEEERLKREEEERLKREEEERLKREEEERLKREEMERLKREKEERLKHKEEERLKHLEEERLKREEEEERKRLEFESTPQGKLQKAIKIAERYELFTFLSELLKSSSITENDMITKAELESSTLTSADIRQTSKNISFIFGDHHYSIVVGEMQGSLMPDDHIRTSFGDLYLFADSHLVVQMRISSETGPEWYDTARYSVQPSTSSVRMLKLDSWIEQIPAFRKSHSIAKQDEKRRRELEAEQKLNETLEKNVSLGKFDSPE